MLTNWESCSSCLASWGKIHTYTHARACTCSQKQFLPTAKYIMVVKYFPSVKVTMELLCENGSKIGRDSFPYKWQKSNLNQLRQNLLVHITEKSRYSLLQAWQSPNTQMMLSSICFFFLFDYSIFFSVGFISMSGSLWNDGPKYIQIKIVLLTLVYSVLFLQPYQSHPILAPFAHIHTKKTSTCYS